MGVGTYRGGKSGPGPEGTRIGKTMAKFRGGGLRTGGGHKVRSRKQAVAVGLERKRRRK